MKIRILLMIFMSLALKSYSQNQEFFKLNKQIKITTIQLAKTLPNLYRNNEKQLTGLSFFCDTHNNCYLKKHFNTDEDDDYKGRDIGDKIDIEIFKEIVKKINELDIDNINYDANISDGISYSLFFSDGKYSINLSAHTAGNDDRSDIYLHRLIEIFDYTWKILGQ